MARKTTGNNTPRSKKTETPIENATVQPVPVPVPVVPEIRKNVTAINAVPASKTNVNLEDEIRRRAYELFLERKGAAGDQNADWLVAEREVRARFTGQKKQSA